MTLILKKELERLHDNLIASCDSVDQLLPCSIFV